MKKTILSTALSLLAIAIVFSSCSQFRNLSFEKRRYNKGFYVHTSETKETTAVAANNAPASSETNIVLPSFVTTDFGDGAGPALFPSTFQPQVFPATAITTFTVTSIPAKENKVAATKPVRVGRPISAAKHNAPVMTKKAAHPKGGDTNIVLLVILCFLLPWLAVYLKEGSITTNFWIDLLLWFLFILPGVIFALLVVFDVI